MKILLAALCLASFVVMAADPVFTGVVRSGWTTTTNPATARAALGVAAGQTNWPLESITNSGFLPDWSQLPTNLFYLDSNPANYVDASVTNGLATTTYVDTATNDLFSAAVATIMAATNDAETVLKAYTDTAANALSGVLVTRMTNATNDLAGVLVTRITNATNDLGSTLSTKIQNSTNDLSGVLSAKITSATNDLSGVLVTRITNATNDLSAVLVTRITNSTNDLNTVLRSVFGWLSGTNEWTGTNKFDKLVYLDSLTSTNGDTNLSLTASTALLADVNKKLVSLANGGANTVLHGTTPPAYSSIANADLANSTVTLTDPAGIGSATTLTLGSSAAISSLSATPTFSRVTATNAIIETNAATGWVSLTNAAIVTSNSATSGGLVVLSNDSNGITIKGLSDSSGRVLALQSQYGTAQLTIGGGAAVAVSSSFTTKGGLLEINSSGGNVVDLVNEAANVLQLASDSGTPSSQTLKGPDGSGANIVGGNFTIAPGRGTGTGGGGALLFSTGGTSNATGSAQAPLTNVLAFSPWPNGGIATGTNFSKFDTNAPSLSLNTWYTNNSPSSRADYIFRLSYSSGVTDPVNCEVLVANQGTASGTWDYRVSLGEPANITGTWTNTLTVPIGPGARFAITNYSTGLAVVTLLDTYRLGN